MAKKAHRELKGKRCPKCNGSGSDHIDAGGFYIEVDCAECSGTGIVNSSNACVACSGSRTKIVNMSGLNVEINCSHCNGSGLEPFSA
jgi:DnaJ-class molecular chaperone